MFRTRALLSAVLCIALASALQAQVAEGNYLVSYVTGGTVEQAVGIVKLKVQGGMVSGELVAGSPRIAGLGLQAVTLEGKTLRIVFKSATAGELAFETPVPAAGAKRLLGSAATDTVTYPALATMTDQTALDPKALAKFVDCPPLQQARTISQKGLLLRFQANQNKDPEKKAAMLKQAAEADLKAKEETPKLYREVLAKYPESTATLDAALNLIRDTQSEATADELKTWALTAGKAAKAYGPRWHAEAATQLAGALVNRQGLAGVALDLAKQAEAQLSPKSPPATKSKTLTLLAQALRKNGKEAEAKVIDGRIAQIEQELDREYLAKVPPFKGTPFPGRQSKSDRAVFMELFTGATCPPCVAADVAFDVLAKNYKPTELVLIQYHMHIPGPDPMTNPDTEARWAYYQKSFPKEVRGVPSSIFNGKPQSGGGGPMAFAEKKYEAYRETINPLLEQPAGAKLTAHAVRKGNKIDIDVTIAGLTNPTSDRKLRILLAEETVRYAGSNKIRFHHHVVRAFPGGVDGIALTEAMGKHRASIDLDELRSKLTQYLDNYEATKRPFANPARPMDFTNLIVVAFVQDDSTREILQATQVEVEGKK